MSPTQGAATDATRTDTPTVRVGVLSPHNSKETKAILNAIHQLGHTGVWVHDDNVTSWIEDGTVHVDPEVDVLINRVLLTKSDRRLEDSQLAALYEHTTPVLNPPSAVHNTLHKYRAGVQLTNAGLPVPDAFYGRSTRTFDRWNHHLPETAVHKRTVGTNGHHMTLVSEADAVNPTIANQQSFLQEYLHHTDEPPYDLRVYVVGDHIVGAMRRYAPDGEWRTNVALGGVVEDATNELGPYPRQLAKKATAVLDLDISGVDLMPVDGDWYILEVNTTAGFKGLYAATGISAAPYIAGLAIRRAGGPIDKPEVEPLASILDDSRPPTADQGPNSDGPDGLLGVTTKVGLSGSHNAATATAKVDTGAERTSIDTQLAGRIGAGPLTGTTRVRSGTNPGGEIRPLVELDLRLCGRWQSVTASLTDRTAMTYPVLLGRDVLNGFTIDPTKRVEE